MAEKRSEQLEALYTEYAEIHRNHPFHVSPNFAASLRALIEHTDFRSAFDAKEECTHMHTDLDTTAASILALERARSFRCLFAAVFVFLTLTSSEAQVLPQPDWPFQGKVDIDARNSTPDWPKPPTAPKGAPNIVLILLDDTGFSATSTDVGQYKKKCPMFPHESTNDQFFSEDQFESYRRLGEHVGLQTFDSWKAKRNWADFIGSLRRVS